jgi:hypothetical protein
VRWILAGLAFALLVALSVFTVSIRTRNLTVRAWIAGHNDQIVSLRVEQARRMQKRRGLDLTADLIQRLRRYRRSSPFQ